MIDTLVVNGCSYMDLYAQGNGHIDLARQHLNNASSIARPGSNNSRIIRTTLKHSYAATSPTMYVVGMTFISRLEIPILREYAPFEGKWTNPLTQVQPAWDHHWKPKHNKQYVELSEMLEVYSLLDRTEDLMYNIISMIDSLEHRGHRVLVFQYVDDSYFSSLDSPQLTLFKTKKNFVHEFNWTAVQYQHQHGVQQINDPAVPVEIQKPLPGHHSVLNKFLVEYINATL